MLNKDHRWDIDLSVGNWAENLLVKVLQDAGGHIEVKFDLQWKRTGNIFVEYECFYVNEGKVKPSALSTSESEYYAFVLDWPNRAPLIKLIPTDLLKKVVEKKGTFMPANQDGPNPTSGYLIKLEDIEDFMRGR